MAFRLGKNGSKSLPQLVHAIETATDGRTKDTEDWSLFMGICDLINTTEDGPKEAMKTFRKRFATKHPPSIILTLSLLETCVKNCGKRFHVHLASKDFLQDFMKIISPKNNYSVALQNTVLGLLQTWAYAFQSSPELKEVCKTYQELKAKGVDFPPLDADQASKTFISAQSAPVSRPVTEGSCYKKTPVQHPPSPAFQTPYNPASLDLTGRGREGTEVVTSLDPEKMNKLRSDLATVQQNCKVFGDLLTEVSRGGGSGSTSDLELLEELNSTCRGMQERVLSLIQKIQIDSVTEELLLVNDELNNVFLRYDRYRRMTSGQGQPRVADEVRDVLEGSPRISTPMPLAAAAVGGIGENEVPVDNLIDLNDSPAAEAVGAGMANLSLNTTPKQNPYDPFSPVDPGKQTLDFTNVGEVNQRDFEEMEEWLKKNETPTSNTTTSSEFERFLAERINAGSQLPPANQKQSN